MGFVVELKNITKTFPLVVANDSINLEIEKGEVRGLLGENGAGKTVLMSILYGLYRPDKGEIKIDGKPVYIDSPKKAIELGIGMVHQQFKLAPSLTVAENIVLGREKTKNKLFLDYKEALKETEKISEKFKLPVSPDVFIHSLSIGIQQRVEILKALYRNVNVLILDEPTSVLTPQEAKELFKAIKNFKKEGRTVIFISHKLNEVFEVCDNITVLRKGKVIGTKEASSTTKEELAQMMVGRKVLFTLEKKPYQKGEKILEVKNLKALSDRGIQVLKEVSFNINSNEILGIAGVEGNGQLELEETLIGTRKIESGKIFIKDIDLTKKSTEKRMDFGISYIPSDRIKHGLIRDFSVRENLLLGFQNKKPFKKGFVNLSYEEVSSFAKTLIDKFNIQTSTDENLAKNLSGGNQQKVVLARELSRNPKLVIASNPTVGLDVGATEYVRNKLIESGDSGAAVLLISADLDEILDLSDRIAVLYEGKIVKVLERDLTDEKELGFLMAGGRTS